MGLLGRGSLMDEHNNQVVFWRDTKADNAGLYQAWRERTSPYGVVVWDQRVSFKLSREAKEWCGSRFADLKKAGGRPVVRLSSEAARRKQAEHHKLNEQRVERMKHDQDRSAILRKLRANCKGRKIGKYLIITADESDGSTLLSNRFRDRLYDARIVARVHCLSLNDRTNTTVYAVECHSAADLRTMEAEFAYCKMLKE